MHGLKVFIHLVNEFIENKKYLGFFISILCPPAGYIKTLLRIFLRIATKRVTVRCELWAGDIIGSSFFKDDEHRKLAMSISIEG